MSSLKNIKVVIGYPPIDSEKGTPLLSQNRQFQFFHSPTYIYPMVPAYAASNFKKQGYKVFWLDGIAEKLDYRSWFEKIKKIKADYLLIETKTPIIKTHWKQINDLKSKIPTLKIILVGDHVTFLPLESFEESQVDYVIAGGDYDFISVNLLNHLYKKEILEGGVYWREENKDVKAMPQKIFKSAKIKKRIYNSGYISLKHDLNTLPFVDRDLTKWKLYAYKNGNYKYTPGTYMYSARDCWWGRCSFCIWNHTLNPIGSYRRFTPERLLKEVKYVVDKYRVKEIFDDAGTFMVGKPLVDFCNLLIESNYNKKVFYGCNMRFGVLNQEHYDLMKKANFRSLLYGLESANQKTLDKLNKGINSKKIEQELKMVKKAGLEVHLAVMIGYPWETYNDAIKTLNLVKYFFAKGDIDSLQATIFIPYPGTPLWEDCKNKGLLKTLNYEDYDMRKPVIKTSITEEQMKKLVQKLYSSFLTPSFLIRKIIGLRSFSDIKFLITAGNKVLSHLLDFS